MSGRLIDKYGAKSVLLLGLTISLLGAAFLILVTTNYPGWETVVVGLMLMGLGMGFTIGAPMNYMMLENTKPEEANSALAVLSLIRSIGTTIAPAIMIGFLAHAGGSLQDRELALLPKEIIAPQLPYAQELTVKLNELKSDEKIKDKLAGVELPDLSSTTKIEINMTGEGNSELPEDLVELLKTADVTNITERIKIVSSRMFSEMTPSVIADIQKGVQTGIEGIQSSLPEIDQGILDLKEAVAGVTNGIDGMEKAVARMDTGIADMKKAIASQETAIVQLNSLYDQITTSMEQDMPQGAAFPIKK